MATGQARFPGCPRGECRQLLWQALGMEMAILNTSQPHVLILHTWLLFYGDEFSERTDVLKADV